MWRWGKFKRSVTKKRKKSGHQNRSKLRILSWFSSKRHKFKMMTLQDQEKAHQCARSWTKNLQQ